MVNFHAINFVTDGQIRQIQLKEKIAFFRMENEVLNNAYNEFNNNKKIELIIGHGRIRAWIYLTYIDYFKWKEIKNDAELIKRAGYEDKDELKDFLKKLYGIELDEDPYIYYVEFECEPFPKLPK